MNSLKTKSVAKVLATTNTTIYTAPAQFRAEVESLVICSSHNNAAAVTIQWFDVVDNAWYNLFSGHSIPANGTVLFENVLYLERLGAIRASSTVANAITVTLKLKETFALSNV